MIRAKKSLNRIHIFESLYILMKKFYVVMPNIVAKNMEPPKEFEMQDMTEPKVQVVNITRVVKCCRHCQMVNINDRVRMLCPYCGTFYDSKAEREKNQTESRHNKNEKILKGRKNQNDKSDDEETQKLDAESIDFKHLENNGGGVKNFFRNLISRKSVNKRYDENSSQSSVNKPRSNSIMSVKIKKKYVIMEETNLTHRFLTIKNNEPSLFSEYRNHVLTFQDSNEFK